MCDIVLVSHVMFPHECWLEGRIVLITLYGFRYYILYTIIDKEFPLLKLGP